MRGRAEPNSRGKWLKWRRALTAQVTREGCQPATAAPEFPLRAGHGSVPATHDCATQTCHSAKEAPRGVHSLFLKKYCLGSLLRSFLLTGGWPPLCRLVRVLAVMNLLFCVPLTPNWILHYASAYMWNGDQLKFKCNEDGAFPFCIAPFVFNTSGFFPHHNAAFLLASEITMSNWIGPTCFLTHSRNEIQVVLVF